MSSVVKLLLIIAELLLGLKRDYESRRNRERIKDIRKNPVTSWNDRFGYGVRDDADEQSTVQSRDSAIAGSESRKSDVRPR